MFTMCQKDGRQAWGQSQRSERLTRVETNYLEEVMLTIVFAATVC